MIEPIQYTLELRKSDVRENRLSYYNFLDVYPIEETSFNGDIMKVRFPSDKRLDPPEIQEVLGDIEILSLTEFEVA